MKTESPTPPTQAEALKKLRELVKELQFGMLTTITANGALRSRPMGTQQIEGDESIWFFAAEDSPKVDEIRHDQQVCLAYSSPQKQKYVSISGRARVVKDRQKAQELWTPLAKAWFPGGVDDPKLVLINVPIESAEYWDSPSSKVVQFYGLAKAAITGEPPKNLGEHAKVRP
jgi:general stress protein 26